MSAPENTIDILLLGSGGREHALAAKLAESPRCGTLYIAPGNGGTLKAEIVAELAVLFLSAAYLCILYRSNQIIAVQIGRASCRERV